MLSIQTLSAKSCVGVSFEKSIAKGFAYASTPIEAVLQLSGSMDSSSTAARNGKKGDVDGIIREPKHLRGVRGFNISHATVLAFMNGGRDLEDDVTIKSTHICT